MTLSELYDRNYVPYSENPAVALVRSQQGAWFPGIRIENISYPLSISASQNALFCCLSEGHQPSDLFTDAPGDTMLTAWQQELELSVHPLQQERAPTDRIADLLLDPDTDLQQQLRTLLDQAVVNESNFPVSAVIQTDKGYFTGVNVECSSWSMGLCAERIAIAKALTYGATSITGLHIHTREGEFSSPCGACRQVIIEHLPDRQVHLHHADGSESVHFSNDLLPYSFRSSSLSKQ